jgi:hypothetical protein
MGIELCSRESRASPVKAAHFNPLLTWCDRIDDLI